MRSPSVVAAARALGVRLSRIRRPEAFGFALRVLQIGVGPATSETLRFAAGCGARVTVLDLDPPRLERARLKHGEGTDVSFCGDLDALPDRSFDLIVSAGGLSRLAARSGAFGRLAEKCAADALIMAVEPIPSLFRDLTVGLTEGDDGDQRELRLSASGWASECSRAGLVQIDARLIDTGADHAVALSAKSTGRPERPGSSAGVALLCNGANSDGSADGVVRCDQGAAARPAGLSTRPRCRRSGRAPTFGSRASSEGDGDGSGRLPLPCVARYRRLPRPR